MEQKQYQLFLLVIRKEKNIVIRKSHSVYLKQVMRCPHFSKVNFQRIKQVKNDQGSVFQQTNQEMRYSIFSIDSLSEDVYTIPQECGDNVDSFSTKVSNYKHAFGRMSSKDDIIKQCQRIKMPKQMNIKRMISNVDLMTPNPILGQGDQFDDEFCEDEFDRISQSDSSEETDIPSEQELASGRKNPHILISKTSMMGSDSYEIFNGIAFLDSKYDNPHSCQLKDYIIKISKQDKIKYFIELQKVYVSICSFEEKEKCIKFLLKCKNKTQTIKIYFINSYQKQIFREVYLNCVKKIKQKKKVKKLLQQNKQNRNHHKTNNNNYLCVNEEQLSEILNEKDVLVDEDLTESISSLSMNSYEGDSLVFETQRMRFEQVKDTCSTFDILLFKNKSLMSKVQRIFTNSDYDHTALLLKTTSNDLLMLQATSNSGVAIYTFNSLLKIDRSKYFQRIGLRKYTGDKNLIKISHLQNFIRKTVGKKYKFDPMYLIRSQANQQKQTFFCSQLVAEALQESGILSSEFPSFKYLPKHFAEESLNNVVVDGKFSDIIILE